MGRGRRFVEAAARRLTDSCPPEARFLRWNFSNIEGNTYGESWSIACGSEQEATVEEATVAAETLVANGTSLGKNKNNASQVCPHCFQVFLPGNFRVRLNAKMKVTPQIQKLLILEGKNYKLNLKQTKLLKKYKHSQNVLLITCNVCRKTTRHYGESRKYSRMKVSTLKSSTFSNKTMPSSHRLSGSKTRESPSTFRISTPYSSSRTSKNAKLHFMQLKRLLSLEENKKSDKGDLKNFLSSL